MTLLCNERSCFFPAVWPSGKSRKTPRGTPTASVMLSALVKQTVEMPAASSCLAISPTD